MKTGHQQRQEHFMELYQPVHHRLVRYVQTMVWNREDAKDILGETVLKAYEHFDDVQKPESFLFYLFTIARRLWFKMKKRNNMHESHDMGFIENMEDPAINLIARTELLEFKKALGLLPEKQREAIVLFEVSGFSLAEIQALQGGTLSGVKSRVVRARETLGRMLEYTGNQKGSIETKPNHQGSALA